MTRLSSSTIWSNASQGWTNRLVAPLNCTIQKGYVNLVGPDGAGKTTLMRMLAGLLKPDEGTASVLGLDPIKDDGALHAMLGYMPQKFGLYEDLTVMENLNLYADLRSVISETRQKTFARLLEFTSLGLFTVLTGGQALRRDEAKAGAGLYARRRTKGPAAGRARRRRGPHLPP